MKNLREEIIGLIQYGVSYGSDFTFAEDIADKILAMDKSNELNIAVKAFLVNPIGKNKELMADIVGVDLQGKEK